MSESRRRVSVCVGAIPIAGLVYLLAFLGFVCNVLVMLSTKTSYTAFQNRSGGSGESTVRTEPRTSPLTFSSLRVVAVIGVSRPMWSTNDVIGRAAAG